MSHQLHAVVLRIPCTDLSCGECPFNEDDGTPAANRWCRAWDAGLGPDNPSPRCSACLAAEPAHARQHVFEADKKTPPETWARPGKPEWPTHLTLSLKSSRAFQVMQEILAQLKDSSASAIREAEPVISITIPGKLTSVG